jgi:outer membrane protein TolC
MASAAARGCAGLLWLGMAIHAQAQATGAQAGAPVVTERVTFQQAIDRATRNNPSVAAAAAAILRAEGLVRQARGATLLQANGGVTVTTLNQGVAFNGIIVQPQTQVTGLLNVDFPVLAGAAWARRAQAEDAREVATLGAADSQRQIAVATADAYLSIIAAARVVEANLRARDVAQAHYELANELEQRGTGSHLNTLRAQQQVSSVEVVLESARLGVYRAQEALGVLLVADGPVDVADEPLFELPADAVAVAAQTTNLVPALLPFRTDLKLFAGQVRAADRVARDTSKDYWPSLDAVFLPQTINPSGAFVQANSWRFLLQSTIPIFDSAQRAAVKVQRQASLDTAQATLAAAFTQAASQVRAAREAVVSGERGLASARAAADEARQVVNIVNISFRAGAATNIEVIDAERSARDADTAVAVAEDTLRRARLELLTSLGRFP